MKPEVESELNRILNRFRDQLSETSRRIQQAKTEEQQVLTRLSRLCDETIRPAMEEVGTVLRKRGYDYEIKDARRLAELKIGHMSNLVLGMAILPEDAKRSDYSGKEDRIPHILVSANVDQRDIQFGYESYPEGGYGGHYEISEVTPESVERELLKMLEKILARRAQNLAAGK